MTSRINGGELTGMESALLRRFWELYGSYGFPVPDQVIFVGRKDTGGGRYLTLASDSELHMKDGYYDLGGAFVELDCLQDGLMAVVAVENSRLRCLEITPYGDVGWNGDEAGWRVVD